MAITPTLKLSMHRGWRTVTQDCLIGHLIVVDQHDLLFSVVVQPAVYIAGNREHPEGRVI